MLFISVSCRGQYDCASLNENSSSSFIILLLKSKYEAASVVFPSLLGWTGIRPKDGV
jgi:hypothetical protein